MKRTLICAALTLSMSALPMVSEAHGWGGHGGYGYHGGGYYHGGGFGRVIALPFLLGAAAIGAVATIATVNAAPPPPVVYGSVQPAYGYAPAPAPYGYAPAPYGYVAPPQTCTYYPNGATYCR